MNDETTACETDNPKPDFVAELTPYRSLGRTGFFVLMGFVSVTCFMSGIMFLVIGAWPVFLFMGLDVLVIWLAFKINYRAARAKERISVGRDELKIQKFDPAGRMVEHVFNPFWTRFEVDRHKEIGITGMRITSKDRSLPIGAFLNPDDRESFAAAFGNALVRARN
ncbi:MAG: DUF2244 domain-containing protein [Pseudomonadota bacterium]